MSNSMHYLILVLALISPTLSCGQAPTQNTNQRMESTHTQTAIEKLLFNYQDALNASDVDQIVKLYTSDGVFMPQGAPSSIGSEQLAGAYEFVFKNIQLDVKFTIDEIVLTGEGAFARTVSQGTTLIHATGDRTAEENRELFVLQQENGEWKIARYMFNKMK